ncbi:MAG: hypothetical protein M3Q42_05305 [Pseudomonadota bacterium]|nr:hypothetical protein [Pseudomonadota bacterium]
MKDDERLRKLAEQGHRIEAKLDRLIDALAGDDPEGPVHDLDGNRLPRERAEDELL